MREMESLGEQGPEDQWMKIPPYLWKKDYRDTNTDADIELPRSDLKNENIGTKISVEGLFDKWTFKERISLDRGKKYADITQDCAGLIEIDFAPSLEQWHSSKLRSDYYSRVDKLIKEVGKKLLSDMRAPFDERESDFFIELLKALAWQESSWQHYLRYKDRFFVIVSPYEINALGDWGITQVARSSFEAKNLLNETFFENKGYCSIFSTAYYGFLEFYFCYLNARNMPCNSQSRIDKALGAYNRYVSGFSSCHDTFSNTDINFANFQIRALLGFSGTLRKKPWKEYI